MRLFLMLLTLATGLKAFGNPYGTLFCAGKNLKIEQRFGTAGNVCISTMEDCLLLNDRAIRPGARVVLESGGAMHSGHASQFIDIRFFVPADKSTFYTTLETTNYRNGSSTKQNLSCHWR